MATITEFFARARTRPIRTIALLIVGFLSFAFVLTLTQTFFNRTPFMGERGGTMSQSDGSFPARSDTAMWKEGVVENAGVIPSIRNVVGESVSFEDAPLERRAYYAHVWTSDVVRTCGTLTTLREQTRIIFENYTQTKTSCTGRFKVERAQADEVLSTIRALHPDNVITNTEAIEEQIRDYTSELEILTAQQQLLEETLTQTTAAYENLTQAAQEAHDVETLARVISSKLEQVERLTRERVALATSIEQLMRAKTNALENVQYVRFMVDVELRNMVNWESIHDSWMNAIQQLTIRINTALERLTIGLLANLVELLVIFVHVVVIVAIAWVCYRTIRSHLPREVAHHEATTLPPVVRRRTKQQTSLQGVEE